MKNKQIDVALDYKEEVLRDFFKFQMNVRQHMLLLFMLAGVVAIGAGVVLWFVIEIPAVGVACGIVGLLIMINYPFQIHRAIKNQNFKALGRPNQRLKISDDCLVQYINDKSISYEWDIVLLACETKKYLYLYNSKYGALIIQKQYLKE